MKKILIILLITGISLAASAQHRFGGSRHYYPRSRVIVGIGAPIYPYYGYRYYDPFYSPVYRYPRESRLDLKIEDIKSDYQDRIWSARHDKSLGRAERKKMIHDLKYERDRAIHEAEINYYKSRR